MKDVLNKLYLYIKSKYVPDNGLATVSDLSQNRRIVLEALAEAYQAGYQAGHNTIADVVNHNLDDLAIPKYVNPLDLDIGLMNNYNVTKEEE